MSEDGADGLKDLKKKFSKMLNGSGSDKPNQASQGNQQQQQQEHQGAEQSHDTVKDGQQKNSNKSAKVYNPKPEDFRYKMNHKERGLCVIINNEKFLPRSGQCDRPGSDVDAKKMKELFEIMGYKVEDYLNKTAEEMKMIALNACKDKHTDRDSFVMVILSHGDSYEEIYGVDESFSLYNVLDNFKFCETLRGKPKLFFIQACRGSMLDEGAELPIEYEVDAGEESHEQQLQRQIIPLEADFLYAYSTPPDHYAFRNETNGAWFIQAIYQVFKENWQTMEIQQMMTRVNHMVAYKFTSTCDDKKFHAKKQVSSVVSMLTKELYFTRNCESSATS